MSRPVQSRASMGLISAISLFFLFQTALLLGQPTVTIYTDKDLYLEGETVDVSLSARNLSEEMSVDVYIGYINPTGFLYTLGSGGWTSAIEVWVPDLNIPSPFNMNPTVFFTYDIPSTMPPIGEDGQSTFAAGLAYPGEFRFVSSISFADFEVQSETGAPEAFIDGITPNPAMQGVDEVSFFGHGVDSDGRIIGHKWQSDLDGILSLYEDFSVDASELTVGTHTISYTVQDNEGNESHPATDVLEVQELSGVHFYVNGQTGIDTNNGSIASPFRTIGRALGASQPSASNRMTIHVQAGTYSRGTNGEIFPINMRSYVTLIGASPETTILDAQTTAYHVLSCNDVVDVRIESLKIKGGNAKGYGAAGCGGGILCTNSSPVIRDNMITMNEAINGAGIYCSGYSSPQITDNSIGTNIASYGGGIMSVNDCCPLIDGNDISFNIAKLAGGILCYDDSSPTIQNNEISSNSATGTASPEGCGGAISCLDDCSPSILSNTIVDNEGKYGGAIACLDHSEPEIQGNSLQSNSATFGGGIFCDDSSPDIVENTIEQNTAGVNFNGGGGIYCDNDSSPLIDGNTLSENTGWAGAAILCTANSSPTIRNNEISDNAANAFGGGIYCIDHSDAVIENNSIVRNTVDAAGGGGVYCLTHCSLFIFGNTIADNEAAFGGGIMCSDSTPEIIGNLLVDNTARVDGGAIVCIEHANPEISNNTIKGNSADQNGDGIMSYEGCNPTIQNCIIWDNGDDLYGCVAFYCCIEDPDPGDGNIHDDPIFAAGPRGSFYLDPDSPCIDAGNTSAAAAGLAGRTTQSDGSADSGLVDLGYHYPLP
ncbi:MAG: right-handed parallel beta-helix repeat-containing protein [Candidatus Coatesbacteria bacterium]|nr:right-handed parallel beta-helix repeat-containing protein [Candidatus Coatesbacteria bacterium]